MRFFMMGNIYILNLLAIGFLLLLVTLGSGWISQWPLSFTLIYLVVGIILGPYGFGLIQIRQSEEFDAQLLERITEFVVIVSVFTSGLKIVHSLRSRLWHITKRLLIFLMLITIFALAGAGKLFLGMNWGEAILLGAILAPTDPVLASEVQLTNIQDDDELRFGLTSEGGLNDALAFPFVYLGLYALKDPDWSNWFWTWLKVDVIWAIATGIGIGIVVPKVVVWCDRKIQQHRQVDELMEDFIALSLILLTYSLTELVNGYGFIAVFVAGLVDQRSYKDEGKPLAQLAFLKRIEKLLEVGTILILGSILLWQPMLNYAHQSLLIAFLLFMIIRPVGAWLSTMGKISLNSQRRKLHSRTRLLLGWFGIRGVGSLYYLTYAFSHGLKEEPAEQIAWIVLTTIVLSTLVHGISATPLMKWYENYDRPRTKAD